MKLFKEPHNLYSIQYPDHWKAKIDNEEKDGYTHIFFNPDHDWGVFRISAIILEPNERNFKEFVYSRLKKLEKEYIDYNSNLIKIHDLDVLCYRMPQLEGDIDIISYYWETGDNFIILLTSYSVAEKDESLDFVNVERNLIREMLETLVIFEQ